MTIKAHIAVEKIRPTPGTFTFRTEVMDVEPLVVLRHPCGSSGAARNRYYYDVIVKAPSRMHPDYNFALEGPQKDRLRLGVSRRLNPKWKPPVFPEGARIVEVGA